MPAAELPLVSVNLATVALESLLYGVFLVLTAASVVLTFARHHSESSNVSMYLRSRSGQWRFLRRPMFIGTVAIFITVTGHWILTVYRLFDAFVNFEGGHQALEYYANLSQISEVVKTGFLMASLVIGDTMIIYRLWVVWGHNYWVTIFPVLTCLGLTVCGVGITYQFTQYVPGMNVFASEAGRWITSDCVFTLFTNLYSSVMIALRLWKQGARGPGGQFSPNIMRVLGIFVESAAIYTSWTIFFFASYQSGSNLQFNAVDMWAVIAGIAFMLIHVRVGLGWAQGGSSVSQVSQPRVTPRTEHIVMQPLAVNIGTQVMQKSDWMDANETDYESPVPSHSMA